MPVSKMESPDETVKTNGVHNDEDVTDDNHNGKDHFLPEDHQVLTPESLVEEVIGCGQFQVIMVFLVVIMTKLPTAATFMFMSFGNYNPGWRCLDNGTDFGHNSSSGIVANDNNGYSAGSCGVFEACDKIEFNPDSSTIVTEWALLCNRSWITSVIISVQMAGAIVGSVISGQLGDSFGRKTVIYGCMAIIAVFNLTSMFCNSWQLFAVFRFFLGGAGSSLLAVYYVLTNEYLPKKWRAPNSALPAWNIGTIIFSIAALLVRDWKMLHLCISILSVICFLPVFWVPESVRWLAIKQKQKRFFGAAQKMARLNKKSLPPADTLEKTVTQASNESDGAKKYRYHHLFHPGYKMYTIIIGLLWMSFSIIYYAISFGVKSLYGDFYINLILLFALEIPFAIFPSFVPNIFGRTKGSALFIFLAALFILTVTGLNFWGSDTERLVGSFIILLAKVTLNAGWCIVIMYTAELYPTVVRGLGLGWGLLWARVGGVISPFVISDNPDDTNASYIAMATAACICCIGIMQLPESKGKALRDTFDDDDDNDDGGDEYNIAPEENSTRT